MSRLTRGPGPWRPGRAALVGGGLAVCALALTAARFVTARVSFPAGSVSRAWVVYDGTLDGSCRNDQVVIGWMAPSLSLGDVDLTTSCPREMAVFSLEYAAWIGRWPRFASSPVPTQMVPASPPTVVPMRIFVTGVPDVECDVPWTTAGSGGVCGLSDAILDLQRLLYYNRTGLQVTPAVITYTGPATGCGHVPDILTSASYAPGAINAFWRADLSAGAILGFTCLKWHAPNILFVYQGAHVSTFAHEVGHVLGLWAPEPLTAGYASPDYWWGHTNLLAGFSDENLMWEGVVAAHHISLGQAFRMNFDARSWVNRDGRRRTSIRACQSDPAISAMCPRLALD